MHVVRFRVHNRNYGPFAKVASIVGLLHTSECVDRVIGGGGVVTERGRGLDRAELDPTNRPGLGDFLHGLQGVKIGFVGLDAESREDVGFESPEDGCAAGLDFGGECINACTLWDISTVSNQGG